MPRKALKKTRKRTPKPRQDGLVEGPVNGVDTPYDESTPTPAEPSAQGPPSGIQEPSDFAEEARRLNDFYFLKRLHDIRSKL